MNFWPLLLSAGLASEPEPPTPPQEVSEEAGEEPPKKRKKLGYKAVHERGNDCSLGFLGWCVVESKLYGQFKTPPKYNPRVRLEAFGAYKVSNLYYKLEEANCLGVGCSIDWKGPSFGIQANVRTGGDSHSDTYNEVTLHRVLHAGARAVSRQPWIRGREGNDRGGAWVCGVHECAYCVASSAFLVFDQVEVFDQ